MAKSVRQVRRDEDGFGNCKIIVTEVSDAVGSGPVERVAYEGPKGPDADRAEREAQDAMFAKPVETVAMPTAGQLAALAR